MHPAPSLILFTSLSGLGFGLLTFLGLATPGLFGWHAFLAFALAYGLACGGLLSSLLHLGNPQRAWRALSQWRSSWLSREGVLAIATLMAFAPVAMARIWWLTDLPLLAVVASLLALTTVFATAMIYAQLRTVPRWHHPLVPAVFLASTLTGGALLSGQAAAAALFLIVLGGLQAAYWHLGDGLFAASGSDMPSATGLGLGLILPFQYPLSMLLGALVAWGWSRKNAEQAEAYLVPISAGVIAGVSIMGVVVAVLNTLIFAG